MDRKGGRQKQTSRRIAPSARRGGGVSSVRQRIEQSDIDALPFTDVMTPLIAASLVSLRVAATPSSIYDLCNSATESHLFGKTVTKKTVTLIREITKNEDATGLYLFCFRTKADMDEAYEAVAGTASGSNPRYRKAVAGESATVFSNVAPYVFCTPNKLCSILAQLKEKVSTIRWITIDGWDRYNPSEFAAVGLVQLYRGDNKFRLVLASVSPYAELPVFGVALPWRQVEVPSSGIYIEYTSQLPGAAATESAVPGKMAILYPGDDVPPLKDNIIWDTFPFREPKATIVVDSLKDRSGRFITKHIAELRADSIDAGVVKRCIQERKFQGLANNVVPQYRKGLDRTIVYLVGLGVPILPLFPENQKSAVDVIMAMIASYKLEPDAARYIIWSKLGLQAGIFFQFWYTSYPAKITNRELFVGCLAACLLDLLPATYAPITAYEKFQGRNDLETMRNMWDSLTTAVKLHGFNKHRVIGWARSNGFYIDPLIQLVLRVIRIHLSNVPTSQFREAQRPMTTAELNTVKVFASVIYGVDTKTGNWDLTEALPNEQSPGAGEEGVIVIHRRGNALQMYINDVILVDPPPRPAPEDTSDIRALYPELFK